MLSCANNVIEPASIHMAIRLRSFFHIFLLRLNSALLSPPRIGIARDRKVTEFERESAVSPHFRRTLAAGDRRASMLSQPRASTATADRRSIPRREFLLRRILHQHRNLQVGGVPILLLGDIDRFLEALFLTSPSSLQLPYNRRVMQRLATVFALCHLRAQTIFGNRQQHVAFRGRPNAL